MRQQKRDTQIQKDAQKPIASNLKPETDRASMSTLPATTQQQSSSRYEAAKNAIF